MKDATQLKHKIKNISQQTGINANAILQNYMLEILLKYISLSKYKDNFILKGGMLVSSLVGISSRTTMDIDATIKGITMTKETLLDMFNEIINIKSENTSFEILNIKDIREEDEYGGFRLFLESKFDTIRVPLKVDISTGDVITPKEINYSYKSMFENTYINILAYNIETILAEKFETILSRGVFNTRARDFYDIYILLKFKISEIKKDQFINAIYKTFEKRESTNLINSSLDIINKIKSDERIIHIWNRYSEKYEFARSIDFDDVIGKLIELDNILKH